ncbi:flagellar basal body-associated FliL family protein [Pelagibacterium limicola]|uniref:flagellar basal body-associated FliL family protein n=1 Tax=Pelagibacterium limicola TaxID=2791022 RepID=UPI0018B014C1|nr:flagellar basal body-associated FliL family protein [Pelagibacterium limicola]
MSDVADSEVDGSAEDGAGAKSGRRRLIIIGGAILAALILAGAAGAWFLVGTGSDTDQHAAADAREPHFFELPVITVNLSTGGGNPEFLRIWIALEVRDEAMMSMIEPRLPRVLDAFQVYLRELRRSDLEGSAGVYRLKEELHRRINLAVYPATVDNILFKEILVQ